MDEALVAAALAPTDQAPLALATWASSNHRGDKRTNFPLAARWDRTPVLVPDTLYAPLRPEISLPPLSKCNRHQTSKNESGTSTVLEAANSLPGRILSSNHGRCRSSRPRAHGRTPPLGVTASHESRRNDTLQSAYTSPMAPSFGLFAQFFLGKSLSLGYSSAPLTA